jgi:hypothetical protein
VLRRDDSLGGASTISRRSEIQSILRSIEHEPALSAAHQDFPSESLLAGSPPRSGQGISPGPTGDSPPATEGEEGEGASDYEFVEDLPGLLPHPDYASMWCEGSYRGSRAALVARAYHHARQLGWTDVEQDNFRQIGTEILCSIPTDVLSDLIFGNIASRAIKNGNNSLFAADTRWLQQSEINAPCVYVNLLMDKNGTHIPRELMSILTVMRRYATVPKADDDAAINEAVAVDNAFKMTGIKAERKHIRAGRHRFLWKAGKSSKLGVRRTNRLTVLQQFCDGVTAQARLRHQPTLPLQYFGYAFNFAKRAKSHQSGEGSSFLMQPLKHICEVLWPGVYRLMAYPVFFVCDSEEAKLGEVLLTLLGHGLAETGRGMAIHQPGINNASADMRGWDGSAMNNLWASCKEFRENMGIFKAGLANELKLLQRPTEGEAQQQEAELAEKWRQIKEHERELRERYGDKIHERITQRHRDIAAHIRELRKEGGEEVASLADAFAQELSDEAEAMERSWPAWWEDVMNERR